MLVVIRKLLGHRLKIISTDFHSMCEVEICALFTAQYILQEKIINQTWMDICCN